MAVARKLAVLLHRLWLTGEAYEPLRKERLCEEAARKERPKKRATVRAEALAGMPAA